MSLWGCLGTLQAPAQQLLQVSVLVASDPFPTSPEAVLSAINRLFDFVACLVPHVYRADDINRATNLLHLDWSNTDNRIFLRPGFDALLNSDVTTPCTNHGDYRQENKHSSVPLPYFQKPLLNLL